jgi:hypothetical protein
MSDAKSAGFGDLPFEVKLLPTFYRRDLERPELSTSDVEA